MSTASTAAPPTITVALPPGISPEQFAKIEGFTGTCLSSLLQSRKLKSLAVTLAITSAVAFGIVLWD